MKKFNITHSIIIFIVLIVIQKYSLAQLITFGTVSDTALVNSLGLNGIVSNIKYTGSPLAIGGFNGVNSNIGIKSGTIL